MKRGEVSLDKTRREIKLCGVPSFEVNQAVGRVAKDLDEIETELAGEGGFEKTYRLKSGRLYVNFWNRSRATHLFVEFKSREK